MVRGSGTGTTETGSRPRWAVGSPLEEALGKLRCGGKGGCGVGAVEAVGLRKTGDEIGESNGTAWRRLCVKGQMEPAAAVRYVRVPYALPAAHTYEPGKPAAA